MSFPPQIAVTLKELAKLEYLVSNFSLLPPKKVFSILAGKHASKLRGRGLDFAEVRKYVKGDDVRTIDWKVTARTKQTHTRVYEEEKERPAFMVIDQSTSMFFASQGTVKSVLAAQLSAIGGFRVLKQGDRIGGLVFNEEGYEIVRPKRSRKSLMHLLELVVHKNQALVKRKKVQSRKGIINEVLFNTAQIVTHDYVVFIASDFLELDEQGIRYLTRIARHNDVIAALISDPMEMELPTGKLPLGDGDRQLLIKGAEKDRKKFREASQELRDNNLDLLAKYRIPVMEITTAEPLNDQLKKIFGKR